MAAILFTCRATCLRFYRTILNGDTWDRVYSNAHIRDFRKAVPLNSGSQPVGRGPLVDRGPLPGGPRPRLGIENFLVCESRVTIHEKVPVLVVELELPLHM